MKLPKWLQAKASSDKQQKFILVPPAFDRDVGQRFDAYTGLASVRADHARLFSDYMGALPRATVLLSPPAEERLSLQASVAPRDAYMSLRFRPLGFEHPHTFVEATVAPQSTDKASVRCSLYHPRLGLGAFVHAPLAKRVTGTFAQVGVRYAHPNLAAGLVAEPANRQLSSAWVVGSYAGLIAGLQLRLAGVPMHAAHQLRDVAAWRARSSLILAYEPPSTSAQTAALGRFSTSIELLEDRLLRLSFFQVRPVVNPLEDRSVVGITNYLDIGIQITVPTATIEDTTPAPGPEPETINLAGSWQVNKNWLLKMQLSDQAAGVCAAVKSWNKVGVVAAANVSYRYGDPLSKSSLRYGLHLQLENFGAKRYERGSSDYAGRAVMQRHAAREVEVANAEGRTQLVLAELPEPHQ